MPDLEWRHNFLKAKDVEEDHMKHLDAHVDEELAKSISIN